MKKTRSGAVSGASASRSAIAGAPPTKRRPILKWGGRFFLALIMLLAAGGGGFVGWLGGREPLAALPRGPEDPGGAEFAGGRGKGRTRTHVGLRGPGGGLVGPAITP